MTTFENPDFYACLKAEEESAFRAKTEKGAQYDRDKITKDVCLFALREASLVLQKTIGENISPDLYVAIL